MCDNMIRRSISIPAELWEAARVKAGTLSVSAVVRRLLEKWVRGEIGLD
jgi:predicted CopG family antitoxin